MCIAIPGKVLEVDGSTAKVDFQGNLVDVTLGLVDAKPGQYVLVHAGCAIQVMEKEQADEIADLYRDMETVLSR
ncbi:MAG: HypC/HybG/HupF family hydrogenase formation chaperone [Anaerovoracaceae bacterium]|nr:HypC/HybG/HupF family hydrogenase formation chaperone [Bacillota bacterium]MDY3954192.1 HypC/HybG/HupF family hydrogenase formation chaperone [Anaerovoracaceae bacterium]